MLILLYAGMQVSKVLGFVLHIYYDIKTFHIVARASCTSPLKPFHTIYHTQYIHSCPFELPFGKALYLHVRRVLSRLKVCQRHEFDSIRLQCSNAQFSSKISCTEKKLWTVLEITPLGQFGFEPFTSPRILFEFLPFKFPAQAALHFPFLSPLSFPLRDFLLLSTI